VLNRFSIFVAPSVFETFGVAVLEASSCALPVVVSDAEGLSEVVRDGKTAQVAPNRDPAAIAKAISLLIENPRLRRELGDNGRQFVLTNYEWSQTAAQMERVYQSVAGFSAQRDMPQDQAVTLEA